MEFEIDAKNLRAALAEIERAERNGFMACRAVFYLKSAGRSLDQCRAEYSDLAEAARENDASVNWGRFQSVTRNNRFMKGKLVPIRAKRK
jgi:hypothetical protein